jgi:hypothetical protein
MYILEFFTNRHQRVRFRIFDWNSFPLYQCYISGGTALHCHAAILFFDFRSRVTYKNVPTFYRDLIKNYHRIYQQELSKKQNSSQYMQKPTTESEVGIRKEDTIESSPAPPQLPLVLCGNMIDLPKSQKKLSRDKITYPGKLNIPYYEISVKYNYNLIKPWLWIARKLLNDESIYFLPHPILDRVERVIQNNHNTNNREQNIQVNEGDVDNVEEVATDNDGATDTNPINKGYNVTNMIRDKYDDSIIPFVQEKTNWFSFGRTNKMDIRDVVFYKEDVQCWDQLMKNEEIDIAKLPTLRVPRVPLHDEPGKGDDNAEEVDEEFLAFLSNEYAIDT